MHETTPTATLESFNPATGDLLGTVKATPPELVQAVVDDVEEVQPFWAQLPLSDRARYMRRAAQVVIDHLDELTALLAREQGRPRTEAYLTELVPTIDALHWTANAGSRVLEDDKVAGAHSTVFRRSTFISYEPLGAIGLISPSSDPWSVPFGEVAIALMCGNGVVLKPSSLTPLIGQRIQDVFEGAGVPEGIVRAVHGDDSVGSAVAGSSVAKVATVGAGRPGVQLVLADARLEHAIAGCVWGAFANAGQSSSGIRRAYVVRTVADRFTEGVVEAARGLRVGGPMSWDTEIGPIVSEERFEPLRELVEEAEADGATRHCGGPLDVDGPRGRFFAPTVLTGVTPEMRIAREVVSGPVLTIVGVRDEEEAVTLANAERPSGASVWTLDRGKGERIARRLDAGIVWLNEHRHPARSEFDFYEYVNAKPVTWNASRARDFRWFPYDRALGTAAHAAAQLLYGRDADKRAALRRGAGSLAKVARRALNAP